MLRGENIDPRYREVGVSYVTGTMAGRGSDGEAAAALRTTTREDLAAVGSRHAGTEAVVALALQVAWLVGALGRHDGPA